MVHMYLLEAGAHVGTNNLSMADNRLINSKCSIYGASRTPLNYVLSVRLIPNAENSLVYSSYLPTESSPVSELVKIATRSKIPQVPTKKSNTQMGSGNVI